MNEQNTIAPTGSFKMIRAMAGIGIICGFLIVITYEGTLPRIEMLRAEALEKAIFKVIPGITQMRPYAFRNNSFFRADATDKNVVYAGYDSQGVFKGIAIVASGQGYADVIKVIYGYDPDQQKIIGFYVLESKETPGLGDRIEKDPSFLQNFTSMDVSINSEGTGLQHPVTTVKKGTKTKEWEVDGISGATISSRAIGVLIDKSASDWAPIIHKNRSVFNSSENE